MPSPRALLQDVTQTAPCRVRNRTADSISYYDNRYTNHTFNLHINYLTLDYETESEPEAKRSQNKYSSSNFPGRIRQNHKTAFHIFTDRSKDKDNEMCKNLQVQKHLPKESIIFSTENCAIDLALNIILRNKFTIFIPLLIKS